MKKVNSVATIVLALKKAYESARRGMSLAYKLGRADLQTRISGRMSTIRKELRQLSKLPLFSGIMYEGVIKAIIK